MRRTKEDAAITRAQLLKAALRQFHEKGYLATTLEDIARAAGTTRGAVYWHFGSKAELFNAVIREQYNRAGVALAHIYATGGTPLEMLRRVLVGWISYAEEDSDFRIMLELKVLQTGFYPELAGGIQESLYYTDRVVKQFAEMIKHAIDAGEVRPDVKPETAAITALGGIIYGITSFWLMNQKLFSLKALAEEAVDIFIRGIAVQPQG
jgi:AcrR family transcriptional regulator